METGIAYTSAINLGREEGFFKDARRIFKPKKTQPSQAQKGKSIIVDCINEDRPIINKNHNSPPTYRVDFPVEEDDVAQALVNVKCLSPMAISSIISGMGCERLI